MLTNFHLTGLFNRGDHVELHHIQLHQSLQDELSETWHEQYLAFMEDVEEVEFDPAYTPEGNERFKLAEFELPDGLDGENSKTATNLPTLKHNDVGKKAFHALTAFASVAGIGEVILFQNFTRSRLIQPGRYFLLTSDTHRQVNAPIVVLDTRLAAIYFHRSRTLLFSNFRNTNTFLPLTAFYAEATEKEILSILSHKKLSPEDAELTAKNANQWERKRFTLLEKSGILDTYSVDEIRKDSKSYGIKIIVDKSKGRSRIVFPTDKTEAKKLLQFLVEQRYLGPITGKLYETNSKKVADQ